MKLIDFKKFESDFKWDDTLHFPIPTINYIMKRTGKDMLRHFDTQLEAEGNIVTYVRTAKNYLFSNRVDELEWEYIVAHNEKLLYQVLEFILEFINFALVTGDYTDIFKFKNDVETNIGLRNAKRSLLGAKIVLLGNVEFRVGY